MYNVSEVYNPIVQVFNVNSIRFVEHPEGKYTFGIVAADLAKVLEHSTPSKMAGILREDWKGMKPIHTPGGTQSMLVIWEPGVYKILNRSNKPNAEPFQDWIAGEVIPSIRKTGSYNIQPQYNLPKTFGEALRTLADTVDELEATQKQLNSAETTIDTYRAIVNEEVALTFKQIADALNIKGLGRNNLMKFLREVSFLVKNKSCAPRHEHIEADRAIVVTKTYEIQGEVNTSQSTKVTFKGLTWILNKLREANYPVNTTARVIWDTYNKPEVDEELQVESKRNSLNLFDFVV